MGGNANAAGKLKKIQRVGDWLPDLSFGSHLFLLSLVLLGACTSRFNLLRAFFSSLEPVSGTPCLSLTLSLSVVALGPRDGRFSAQLHAVSRTYIKPYLSWRGPVIGFSTSV